MRSAKPKKRARIAWAWAVMAASGALGATRPAAARTPVPGEVAIVDIECTPAYNISFSVDSAALDLGAQADLTAAAQWVARTPGGFLRVVGLDGRNDGSMVDDRTSTTSQYLATTGVNPGLLSIEGSQGMTRAEQRALGAPGTVVVLTCWGILP